MAGRAKISGKGKSGESSAKRFTSKKSLKETILGISKPSIRRLVCHGGVKTFRAYIYEETRTVLRSFSKNAIRDSVTYTEHAKRKTDTVLDVVYDLKHQGRFLFAILQKRLQSLSEAGDDDARDTFSRRCRKTLSFFA